MPTGAPNVATFSQGRHQPFHDVYDEYGGYTGWSTDPTKHNYYIGGRCHFLSFYWAAFTHNDKDFFDWIGSTDPDRAEDVKQAARIIIEETILYKSKSMNEEMLTENMEKAMLAKKATKKRSIFRNKDKLSYLEKKKLRRMVKKKISEYTAFRAREESGEFVGSLDNDKDFMKSWGLVHDPDKAVAVRGDELDRLLASRSRARDWLMAHMNQTNTAYTLSMSREGGGHALAAYHYSNGDFSFFDSNYGEWKDRWTSFSRSLGYLFSGGGTVDKRRYRGLYAKYKVKWGIDAWIAE